MALRLFLLFTVVSVALRPSHATQSPAEVYWKTKLGNIPMPKVVKDGLQPGLDASITPGYAQGLSTTTTTSMNNKNYQLNDVFIGYGHEHRLPTTKNYKLNDVFIGYGHEHRLPTEKNYKLNDVFIGYGHEHRLPTEKNYKVNDVFIGYSHRPPPKTVETLNAKHTIDEGLLDDNSVIFFSEKDLIYPRGVMKLQFIPNSYDGIKFLPLEIAKSIPFSSGELSKILNLFSVKPESTNANIMEDTIRMCEAMAINGEDKHCTTSLEDMVDYAISKVGNNVMAYSTVVDKDTIMEYRVKRAQKISKGANLCHKMSYPYAVFYCHSQKKTDTYVVSLVGANGKKIKAIAVCHKDTSSWDPSHLAFQLLKVKPGSMPICHFLNDITMVWVPK